MPKKTGLSIRLVGTKEQLEFILAKLGGKFGWRSSGHFYPRIDEPGFYSYYSDNFWSLPPALGKENLSPKKPEALTDAELRHSRKMAFWLAGISKTAKP